MCLLLRRWSYILTLYHPITVVALPSWNHPLRFLLGSAALEREAPWPRFPCLVRRMTASCALSTITLSWIWLINLFAKLELFWRTFLINKSCDLPHFSQFLFLSYLARESNPAQTWIRCVADVIESCTPRKKWIVWTRWEQYFPFFPLHTRV